MNEHDVCTGDVYELIDDATNGLRGEDQQRIAVTGMEWIALLLKKNQDYGSSVWKSPALAPHLDAGAGILVRMSDKVERLQQLLAQPGVVPEVHTEKIEDTIRDLGAYCLLYLARPNNE